MLLFWEGCFPLSGVIQGLSTSDVVPIATPFSPARLPRPPPHPPSSKREKLKKQNNDDGEIRTRAVLPTSSLN